MSDQEREYVVKNLGFILRESDSIIPTLENYDMFVVSLRSHVQDMIARLEGAAQ